MTITATRLTRAAGICAAIAGLIFIAVQIKHPPMNVASVTTTQWVVRSTAKVIMAALALAGITCMYLRQVRQTRLLGLLGYLLFAVGYLAILSTEVIAASVLPVLAHTSPGYVNDLVTAAAGGTLPDTSAGCRSCLIFPASRTWSAVFFSASRCSAPVSWRGGPRPFSPWARSPPPRSRYCHSRSIGRSLSLPALP
jgi:hypothetical protein